MAVRIPRPLPLAAALALTASLAAPLAAQTSDLPPAGAAPVDQIAPISDAAPMQDGTPDAESMTLDCTFQTECSDTDCAASDYGGRLTVISDGAGLSAADWQDGVETLALAAAVQGRRILAASAAPETGKPRMFSVMPDGQARLTTHLTDPIMAITHIGSCEVAR
ncbi:hypothetical protein [Paracoccus jeotgali]|uniref:hypothetical protein n=1 Tax=Paracoccus jeotgali TaxID=2065379 RepID=UPI0028A9718F|nr:hypothetical protein [Paracoccus jeotgali]